MKTVKPLTLNPQPSTLATRRDFGRGLAAILAAGVAPSVLEGGLRRGLAARCAARCAAMFTPDDYVQNGMIAMWDGEWNAGRGVHDAGATLWKDLVGSRDLTYCDTTLKLDNCAKNESYSKSIAWINETIECITVEFTFKLDDAATDKSCMILSNKQNESRYSQIFHLNYGSFGNLYFESLSVIKRGGVPFQLSDRCKHSISSSWANGTDSQPTYGSIDGVSCLNNNLEGIGRDGAGDKMVVGGLFPNANVYGMKGRMYNIRMYDRALTTNEVMKNFFIDKERFDIE